MILKLYNTLTRSLEEFAPIDPQNVRIYSCGPTVYGEPHLGNMRKYFLDDLLKNTIKHVLGYPATHVVNITDVGHLTGENEGDADHGEDKMEKGARREGLTARDVAKKYEELFHQNCKNLLIDPFDITPRATEHIAEQITMIQELEAKGYTYNIPGDGVYFDTSKMADYGELVGKKHIEGIQGGSRVEDAGKHNPTDFALWKFNITGKKRDMERNSPRGVGFPGRHIECSAMSIKYLGSHFDIHTGGIDHIPVHHTNEIAQSECSHANHPWVNFWVHYQFLNINGQKISKSLGNVVSVQEVLDKGYSAYDLRYFFLQAHYRSFQDFTREGLDAANSALTNLQNNLTLRVQTYEERENDIDTFNYSTNKKTIMLQTTEGKEKYQNIVAPLLNNLNTPELLAQLFTITKEIRNKEAHGFRSSEEALYRNDLNHIVYYLDQRVLKIGLFHNLKIQAKKTHIPENIQLLAEQRRQAKVAKNWQLADELRKQIDDAGYVVLDANESYSIQAK